jgi:hypothetical protein
MGRKAQRERAAGVSFPSTGGADVSNRTLGIADRPAIPRPRRQSFLTGGASRKLRPLYAVTWVLARPGQKLASGFAARPLGLES